MHQYAINPKKIIEVVLLWLLHITPRFFWICQNPYGNEGHFNIFLQTKKNHSLVWVSTFQQTDWNLVILFKKMLGRPVGVIGRWKPQKDVGRWKYRNSRKDVYFFKKTSIFFAFFSKRRREVSWRSSVGGNLGRSSVGGNFEIYFEIRSK